MKRLLSITIVSLLHCFIVSLFLAPSARAADEFETTDNVRYQVQTGGRVIVTQDVSLTNKVSNVYATQYSLSLQGGRIENIQAHDAEGPLKIETRTDNDLTMIQLSFNQQVVGLGKTLSFHLRYEALDLAQKNGQVWEISIPKLSSQAQIDHYSLTLITPLSFGNPAFITPQPVAQGLEGDFNLFQFTKEQILNSGVRAAFGQFQIFDFILNYHLENAELTPGKTEITLPPDTAFQQVFYQEINPPPLNITVDNDGNWQALYRLEPKQRLNLTAIGKVKIFAQPFRVNLQGEPQKRFLLPTQETLQKNLLPQKYWEVNHPLIQAEAKRLKTPREIHQFVVKTLDYDFSRVERGAQRLGAVEALKNPSRAICTEFTDLFIALARAAGIPAREINGYAHTTNIKFRPLGLVVDILHAWPEYWEEKRQIWVPIDPTWEKTTGGIDHFSKTDLNHFVFTLHGQDSETPYPAGSYKTESSFGQDVQVTFGQYEAEIKPEYEIRFNLPTRIFSRTGNEGKIIVKNVGHSALYNLNLEFKTTKNLVLVSTNALSSSIPVLPPFAHQEIPLKLKPVNWLSHSRGIVTVSAGGQEYRTQIEVGALDWSLITPFFVSPILALGLIFMLKINRGRG